MHRDARSQSKNNNTKWQRLLNLKDLYDEGFITLEEYKQRKLQLVDELTGMYIVTSFFLLPKTWKTFEHYASTFAYMFYSSLTV